MAADSVSNQSISEYLADLERALHGADSAVVHDALVDAEAHLREACASGRTATEAIRAYGGAEEIAQAYMTDGLGMPAAGARVAPPAAESARGAVPPSAQQSASAQHVSAHQNWLQRMPVVGIYADRHAWGAVAFLLIGFAFATAAFVWTVTLGSLAIGLLPTLLGIPLLIALLGSARAISLALGKVIECFVGIRMPRRSHSVDVSSAGGFWRRIWLWVKDTRSWLTVAFLIGNFPVAVACFSVVLTLLVTGIALTFGSAFELFGLGNLVRAPDATFTLFDTTYTPDASGRIDLPVMLLLLMGLVGFAILTGTLWLSKGTVFIYAQVVKAIQVARPQAPQARCADGV